VILNLFRIQKLSVDPTWKTFFLQTSQLLRTVDWIATCKNGVLNAGTNSDKKVTVE